MGENGAGKSTLLRVLSGDHQPDDGRLLLDGRAGPVRLAGRAHRAGLRVIQQEPEIVPHVSVAENIYLGALPQPRRLLDTPACSSSRCAADLDRYGFTGALDPADARHATCPPPSASSSRSCGR